MTGSSNQSSGYWIAAAAETAGSGHLERGIPCQDRAAAWTRPRPALVVMDGRGSASHSQVGATATRFRLKECLRARESELGGFLDTPGRHLAAVGWRGFAYSLYHLAASEQVKLGNWFETGPECYEFTLTLALVGTEYAGWLAVGDSPLVARVNGVSGLVAPPEESGYANETSFVTACERSRLGFRGGVFPAAGLEALAAMSDGTASRMLHLRDHRPSEAVGELMSMVARGKVDEAGMSAILEDPAWDRKTRDDRSIALLADAPPECGLRSTSAKKPPRAAISPQLQEIS